MVKRLKIKYRHLTIAALMAGSDEDDLVTLLNVSHFRYLSDDEVRMVTNFAIFTGVQSDHGTPLYLESKIFLGRILKHVEDR